MKTIALNIITSAVAAFTLSTDLVAKDAPPADSFQIDAAHSKVGFEVPHLVISTVEGRFNAFAGDVNLAKDFSKSTVAVGIEVSSIDTGVAKRDDHLRSADFFDASRFPKMTFKSVSLQGSPDRFKLIGDLTIHGVTKSVIFEGQYLGSVTDGYGNEKVAFKASTTIRRQDFGLNWSSIVEAGPVVGDNVTIELNIQAGRPAKK